MIYKIRKTDLEQLNTVKIKHPYGWTSDDILPTDQQLILRSSCLNWNLGTPEHTAMLPTPEHAPVVPTTQQWL